eukprot:5797772-Amphidinium_carterae.3
MNYLALMGGLPGASFGAGQSTGAEKNWDSVPLPEQVGSHGRPSALPPPLMGELASQRLGAAAI